MKLTSILLLLIMLPISVGAAIVNNSTSSPTAEDSLTVLFYSLDSLGNPTTADSVYILVGGPGGIVAFRDSMAISDSRVIATTIQSKQFYSFSEQVSNIDSNGSPGVYDLTILAKKNTGDLQTPNRCTFQIISTELSDQIALISDSVIVTGGAVDSNRTEQGAGCDSSSIAGWVWNTPQTNHTTSGTFGRYLDAPISGVNGGGGAYSVTIVTCDSAAALAVPGVGVTVRTVNQSSLISLGSTGSDGEVEFNLDADSFVVVATAPGYTFPAYDTLVIYGAGSDTIYGYAFDPGQPANANLCRVWGYLTDASGLPASGVAVTASLPSGVVRYANTIISPFGISIETDSVGFFMLDLIPSGDLIPSDTKYEITIARTDGTILRQRVTVPDNSLWQLVW